MQACSKGGGHFITRPPRFSDLATSLKCAMYIISKLFNNSDHPDQNFQDSNPLLKESLQRGEDAAFWMSQKTREIIEATNLDRPLKQMDSMAAKTLEDVEKRTKKVWYFVSKIVLTFCEKKNLVIETIF